MENNNIAKVTLNKLVADSSIEALNELLKLELPVKVWYKVNKIVQKINTESAMISKARLECAKKYAQLDSSGNPVVKPISENKSFFVFDSSEKQVEFFKELGELLATTVEIEQISIADLGDLKTTGETLIPLFGLLIKED